MSIPEAVQCPICDRDIAASKCRKLYDLLVCRKCSHAFANRRQFGWILDWIVLFFLSILIGIVIGLIYDQMVGQSQDESLVEEIFWLVFSWIILPMIFAAKDGFRGYSTGKWVCGVRVVDWNTREPIGFLQSFKRNLPLIIPVVPLVVAFQLIRGRRLGDKWANTAVVWMKHAHRRPFEPRGYICTRCGYDLTGNVSGRCPECGLDIPLRPSQPQVIPVPAR